MIIDRIALEREKSPAFNLNGKDKASRSVAKSVSWRIVGTMDTILLSWIITGQINTALSIGGVELVTKMALFVAHERLWDKINWGRS